MSVWQSVNHLFAPHNNFQNYRDRLAKTVAPLIPYHCMSLLMPAIFLPNTSPPSHSPLFLLSSHSFYFFAVVYLQEVESIEHSYSDTRGEDGTMVNMEKLKKFAKIIRLVFAV